jgi:hypothetical protein
VGVDLSKLTVSLADRMTAIVPDGFHVEAAEVMLWYSADKGRFPGQAGNYQVGRSGTYVRDNFNAHGQTDEDRIAGVPVTWPDLRVGVSASDSESSRLAVPVEHATLRARATGSPARRGISNHDRQEEEGSHLPGLRPRVASGGPEMRPLAFHGSWARHRRGGLGLTLCRCTAEPSLPKLV